MSIVKSRLDNAQAKTLQMQVGFYYERYRFFTEDQFDDPGLVRDLTTPSGFDNFTGTDTSRNAVTLFSGFLPSLLGTA